MAFGWPVIMLFPFFPLGWIGMFIAVLLLRWRHDHRLGQILPPALLTSLAFLLAFLARVALFEHTHAPGGGPPGAAEILYVFVRSAYRLLPLPFAALVGTLVSLREPTPTEPRLSAAPIFTDPMNWRWAIVGAGIAILLEVVTLGIVHSLTANDVKLIGGLSAIAILIAGLVLFIGGIPRAGKTVMVAGWIYGLVQMLTYWIGPVLRHALGG
jgi:hypothetical protein